MKQFIESLKLNPVRLYAVAAAGMAIVAHYVENVPSELWLGLVAAVLGVGGEVVRGSVSPTRQPE